MEEYVKEAAISFYKNGVSAEIICKSLNITIKKLKCMTTID